MTALPAVPVRVVVVRIAWQLPISLALAAAVVAVAGPSPLAAPGVALAAVAPELARVDARTHRLPNRMTLPVLVIAAAVAASALIDGMSAATPAIAAAAFGGGMLLLALFGGVGMGDAKLAAAIGIASPTGVVAIGAPLAGLLLGGVAGTAALLSRRGGRRIPLGPFLLAGWALALVGALVTGASST